MKFLFSSIYKMNDIASEFVDKLIRLRDEGLKIRDDERIPGVWTEHEDEIIEQLEELIDLASTSPTIAENEYERECPIARYQTFMDYLISRPEQNLDLLRFTNRGTARTKVNRRSSKIDICRCCGAPARIEGSKMKCTSPDCGEEEEITSKTSKLKVNAMKHSRNKIETLIGTKEPPKKILDLYPLIELWITDLSYLFDWLHYQETFTYMRNPITFEGWIREFRRNSRYRSREIPMHIEQTEEQAWSFNEYKLIIGELWSMLNECNRLAQSDYTRSNMMSLSDAQVLAVFEAYHIEHPTLPKVSETFEFKNNNYDIGNYINNMALSHEESSIKTKLESIFSVKIRIPGLMCNYFTLTTNKIERHALTEGYSYIVHRVFRIPYYSIPNDDIERMLEIIQAFDAYVRTLYKDTTSKHNSQLYVCKIRCILSLPYFYKYAPVATYMTMKSPDTASKICAQWDRFTTGVGRELVDKYYNIPDDARHEEQAEEEPDRNTSRHVFDGLI